MRKSLTYAEAAKECSTHLLRAGLGRLFTEVCQSPSSYLDVPNIDCVDVHIMGKIARFERRKNVTILFYDNKVYEGVNLPSEECEPMIMILILLLEQKLSIVERLELWEVVSDYWQTTLTYPGEGESAWDYRLPILTSLSRKIMFEAEPYHQHFAHSGALIGNLNSYTYKN